MGLTWVLNWFRRNAPEAIAHLDDNVVSFEDHVVVVRDRRELMMERDTYHRLLKERGWSDSALAAAVVQHKNSILKQVRAG